MKLIKLLPILFIFFVLNGYSQDITLTTNGSTTQCSGNFYDSGGSGMTGGGRYGNNQSYTWTICPSSSALVSLNFTQFDVDGGDILYVYDGNSTAATSLGGYNNNVSIIGTVQATASNPTGCLTFQFISDGSTIGGGWVASISCVQPCQQVQAAITPSLTATSGIIKICQGQSVTFNGSGSYPENGTYYTQSDGTSTYAWTVEGGSVSNAPTTQNTTQTFTDAGAYHVNLIVTDVNDCSSTNSQEIIVEVSTTPDFTGTAATLPTICLGETNTLTGVVTPVTYEEDCTPPGGEPVYLPDGTGTAYTDAITVGCYASGQTITAASQVASICMNMEHSYIGDLDITITCPTGQSVTLLDYETGSNTTNQFLGTPVDNDGTPEIAGTGADYCFSASGSQNMNTACGSVGGGQTLPAGTYLPYETFAGLVGCEVNGDWTISITDNLGSDNGYIFSWAVDFTGITPTDMITFTPVVVAESWDADPTILSTSGNTITVEPTAIGTSCYTYKMTDDFGCTYTNTPTCFNVTAATITPTFAAIPDVCQNATAPVLPTTSTNGIVGTWDPAVSTATVGTTTYTFTPNTGQCALPTTLTITVNPAPTVTVNSETICEGVSATLTATPSVNGGTYVWGDGETTPSITVSPTTTTTYSVVYTLSGCSSLPGTGTITVNPIPTLTVNSTSVCAGGTVTLTATPSTGGGTYLWGGGETTNSIDVSPVATTSYTCVYTLNDCSSLTATGTVTISSDALIDAGLDATICNGESTTITATGGATYTWDNGLGAGASFSVSPTVTTTYSVTGVDAGGCTGTDVVTITVNPVPTVTINSETVCEGTSATLTATPSAAGGTYLWGDGETTPSITITPGTTTTYTCVYTLNTCPSLPASGSVTVNPIPTVTVNSEIVCTGVTATLTATPSATGGSYLWGDGELTESISVTPLSTTTYSVVYTLAGCPSLAATGTVTVQTDAPIDAGLDQIVCENTVVTLTASGGVSYTWDNGVTNGVSFTPAVGTITYTVNGTDASGCTGTDQVVVTVNPLPTVSAGIDQTVCEGVSVTLSGSGAATYVWDNGVTDGIAFTPAVGTIVYTVTGTDLNGCVNTDQVTVTANPLPAVSAGNDQIVCVGTTVTLSGSGALTYVWDNGVTDGVGFVQPLGTMTYTVVGTDVNGCVNTDQVDVNVLSSAPINAGLDQIVCENTVVTLTASGGVSYTWDNGVTDGVSFTPAVGTITYTVNGTDANGCAGTDQVDVTVNPLPTVSAGIDQSLCEGASVTLSGSGAATYVWDNGTTDGVTFTPTVGTVTYTVTGTDLNGCVNTDQVTVTVNPLPVVSAGNDQIVCVGTTVTLSGSGALTYVWDNGVTDGVGFVQPLGTMTYTVVGTDVNGCVNTDQVDVTVLSSAPINAGLDQIVCENTVVTLTASGGVSYTWDNGVTDGVSFTPAVGTITYTVNGTDANGCAGTDQVDVTVNPLPAVSAGLDQAVCVGISVTLSGSGAAMYVWDNGVTDGIAFTPAVGTIVYTVTGTDLNGCVNTDQVTVTVNPLPAVSAGNDQVVCIGTTVTLSGSGALTYVWNNGVTDGVAFVQPLGSMTYTVTGTDVNGCVNTDQVNVNVLPSAPINAGFDQIVCENTVVTLTATGGVSYTWDNGVTNGVPFTPAVGTITYTVNGTDANGCTGTDQVVVTVNPLPTVSAGLDQTVCEGTSVTLSGQGAIGYTWNNGGINGTPFTPAVGSVTYTVTGTDANGCINIDQMVLTVNALPVVEAGMDQTVCQGTAVTLNGEGAFSYSWTNGVTDGVPFTPLVGTLTYTVTGTDVNGCVNTDQVQVTVTPQIVPVFTQIPAICEADPIPVIPTVSGNTPPITGTWSPLPVDNTATGTYTFTPSAGQCATTTTMTITVNPLPTLIITDPEDVCFPLTVDLTAAAVTAGSTGTLSYFSNANGTTPIVSPTAIGASGTYYIETVSTDGCFVILPVNVSINPLPIADFAPLPVSLDAYDATSTMVNNSIGASTYEWFFMDGEESTESNPVHLFNDTIFDDQLIILIATSEDGCKDTAVGSVHVLEQLIFFIPNTFTPDGDKFNEEFKPVFTSGYDPYDFNMLIFNRWGEVVFESHDASKGWRGTFGEGGEMVQDDVYTWKIDFKLKGQKIDKRQLEVGHVNLVR